MFWLLDTIIMAIDGQKFGLKTGNILLSMLQAGKTTIIHSK